MKTWEQSAKDALISGTAAGVATAFAAAALSRAEGGTAAAPINAVSHILWGDEQAAAQDGWTLDHTAAGFGLNHGASVFWAGLYEKLFGEAAERGDVVQAVAGGFVVAGIAYVTDYHLVPKRLTPGYELRLSGRSLAAIYGALALSLGLRGLLQSRARTTAAH